jgi:hypothetical protein
VGAATVTLGGPAPAGQHAVGGGREKIVVDVVAVDVVVVVVGAVRSVERAGAVEVGDVDAVATEAWR